MALSSRAKTSPASWCRLQVQQGLAAHEQGFGAAGGHQQEPFGDLGQLLDHALLAQQRAQPGQGGVVLGRQQQHALQQLDRLGRASLLVGALGPVPQHFRLARHRVVQGAPALVGGVQQLGLDPGVAGGVPPFRGGQLVLDGPDDDLQAPVPERGDGHLDLGLEFPAQGLERVAGPAQVQFQAQEPGFPGQFPVHPDPERQFPGVRVESVQQEILKLRSHGTRLAKVVDLGTYP